MTRGSGCSLFLFAPFPIVHWAVVLRYISLVTAVPVAQLPAGLDAVEGRMIVPDGIYFRRTFFPSVCRIPHIEKDENCSEEC